MVLWFWHGRGKVGSGRGGSHGGRRLPDTHTLRGLPYLCGADAGEETHDPCRCSIKIWEEIGGSALMMHKRCRGNHIIGWHWHVMARSALLSSFSVLLAVALNELLESRLDFPPPFTLPMETRIPCAIVSPSKLRAIHDINITALTDRYIAFKSTWLESEALEKLHWHWFRKHCLNRKDTKTIPLMHTRALPTQLSNGRWNYLDAWECHLVDCRKKGMCELALYRRTERRPRINQTNSTLARSLSPLSASPKAGLCQGGMW